MWDPYQNYLINKLEVLQNKAIRFIFNIKGRDESMTEIRADNDIDSLECRRAESRVKTLLSIFSNESLHPTLFNTLNPMRETGLSVSTRLRSNASLNPLPCRTNKYLHSFIPRTTRELRLEGTRVSHS